MRCWGRENSDFGKVSVSLENTPRNLLETLKLHVDISWTLNSKRVFIFMNFVRTEIEYSWGFMFVWCLKSGLWERISETLWNGFNGFAKPKKLSFRWIFVLYTVSLSTSLDDSLAPIRKLKTRKLKNYTDNVDNQIIMYQVEQTLGRTIRWKGWSFDGEI